MKNKFSHPFLKKVTTCLFLITIFNSSVYSQNLIDVLTTTNNYIENFGNKISISDDGNRFIMGDATAGADNTGIAIVYYRVGDDWVQLGNDILPENDYDACGSSVSISGNGQIVAVGSSLNDNSNGVDAGHVRVYELINNAWTQIGSSMEGESSTNFFGVKCVLSGDGNRIIIGAQLNDNDNGTNSGHARVFELQSNSWVQLGGDIDGEFPNDFSGERLDISYDGNIIAIGSARNSENGFEAGHVRIFTYINNTWEQMGNDIDGEAFDSSAILSTGMDISLSIDGLSIIIGFSGHRVNGQQQYGKAQVYNWFNNFWQQKGQDIIGLGEFDSLGQSVAISGDAEVIAVSSTGNSTSGSASPMGLIDIYRFNHANQLWESIGMSIEGDGSDVLIAMSRDSNYLLTTDTDEQMRVFSLSELLSIEDVIPSNKFIIHPNPTNGMIEIESSQQIVSIEIISIRGKVLQTTNSDSINIQTLPSGIYIMEITNSNGKNLYKRVIKK